MATTLENHPLANIFPMMSAVETGELENSIKTNTQRDEIVLFEGKILDGRNRYAACNKLGISPKVRNFDPNADGDALQYVLDKNMFRRHLTPSQLAIIAAEMMPKLEERAKSEPPAFDGEVEVKAKRPIEQAAEITGASVSNILKATKILADNPDAAKRIKAGESTVHAEFIKPKINATDVEVDDAVERIELVCGAEFGQAVRDGVRLKSRDELIEFALLDDGKMRSIQSLIAAGWKLSKALRYKMQDLTAGHTIRDLLKRADAQGGLYTLEIKGRKITVQ